MDEVDSILIDEARTPLIISGPTQDEVKWYGEFAKIAKTLVRDEDYEVDEKKRTISVLEPGITKVEDHLGIENLYEAVNTPLISFLNNSIKAKELFRNDKEYVVMDGEVLIVDEHTGRMLAGRRYNDGLHQAIEAKEGVTVREEYQTLATVTLQNYFRLYEKLSGMTGTAMTEASEFDKIYGLGVVPIPTNMPMMRADNADLVYRTEEAKYDAVVEDIAERHAKGQPILVGTVSVEKSEHLSGKLRKLGVPHSVLNAKVHADEAKIVAMAGHKGAVTVATNMAGRGTDIMLGGSVEFLADDELRKQGLEPLGETAEEYEAAWPDHPGAGQGAGGGRARRGPRPRRALRRRHRAPRVAADRQPAARPFRSSGRPGRVPVLPVPAGRADAAVQVRLGRPGAPGPQDPRRRADREQAGHQRDRQRPGPGRVAELRVAQERPQVRRRHGPPAQGDLRRAARGARGRRHRGPGALVHRRRRHRHGHQRDRGALVEWDLEQLWTDLGQLWPISVDREAYIEDVGGEDGIDRDELIKTLQADAQAAYDTREAEVGEEVMRELERRVLLSVLDRKWREHLYEMDYLREGIYLRAYSQRDPLVEYQREGFDMFAAMMDGIKEESVGFLFNLEVTVGEDGDEDEEDEDEVLEPMRQSIPSAPQPAAGPGRGARPAAPLVRAKGLEPAEQPQNLSYSAPTEQGEVEVKGSTVTNADDPFAKVGRNAQCPCGSGKKYKMCHGRAGGPTGLTARPAGLGTDVTRSRGRCRASGLGAARTGRPPRGTARRSARGCWSRRPPG